MARVRFLDQVPIGFYDTDNNGGGGGTPGLPFGSIQYNSGGTLSGNSNLLWDNNTNTILLTGSLNTLGSVFFQTLATSPTPVSNVVVYGANGQLFITASTAVGSKVTPGLPLNSIQYNNGGTFSGSSNLLWDNNTSTVLLTGSLNNGTDNIASGLYSHAEGQQTTARGVGSHAEGAFNIASGSYSHAEGQQTTTQGIGSHSEGYDTQADGNYSHTEGNATQAYGYASHTEGNSTQANGTYSHAEGYATQANGISSHAEGSGTQVNGNYSHAEGVSTQASGEASHAEGSNTISSGSYSHAEGLGTITAANYQHAQGIYNITSSISGAFILGNGTGPSSRSNLIFAAGNQVQITGSLNSSGSVFFPTLVTSSTAVNDVVMYGTNGQLFVTASTAVGNIVTPGLPLNSIQYNDGGTFNGDNNLLWDNNAGALSLNGSLTNGSSNTAGGIYSHAEGQNTTASGFYSHTEGANSQTIGNYSHAEGNSTIANGFSSHAEGSNTITYESASHAEGLGTIASASYQHAQGMYNITSSISGAFILGNGTSNVNRSNLIFAAGNQVQISGSLSNGFNSTASGLYSHAEGQNTTASGDYSHAEGRLNIAYAQGSHAEGLVTTTSGNYSHAEGVQTTAYGQVSHAEGGNTISYGFASHAEGFGTISSGSYSHAEGAGTIASGDYQHTQGTYNITSSITGSFILGNGTDNLNRSNLILAYGNQVQITGSLNTSGSIFFPTLVTSSTPVSNVVMYGTNGQLFITASTAVGSGGGGGISGDYVTTASFNAYTGSSTSQFAGTSSFATTASYVLNAVSASYALSASQAQTASYVVTAQTASYVLSASYALSSSQAQTASYVITAQTASYVNPLNQNVVITGSLTNGVLNSANNSYSHAEGVGTVANGNGSHTEGESTNTTANGSYSHTEGTFTTADGYASHAEGANTTAYGYASHAEGRITEASGGYSHAEGYGTITDAEYQHAQGLYNITSLEEGAFILGNGTDDNNRSNLILAYGNQVQITGSLNVTQGITGSLFGTSSWATDAINAATASYVNPLNQNVQITGSLSVTNTLSLDGNLMDSFLISSTSAGSNNLFTQATGSYTSAHGKYTVYKGANTRAGEFVTAWNGTTTSNYDNSTADIGLTTDVSFTSSIVTGQIQINANTLSSGWTVKMLVTYL
jgi:hypothetical protein